MNAETLAALKASIAKWDANARAKTPEEYLTGVDDCALCDLFMPFACDGCPVSYAVGRIGCNSTPYVKADSLRRAWECGIGSKRKAHAAARAEAAFLRTLLPPGETV